MIKLLLNKAIVILDKVKIFNKKMGKIKMLQEGSETKIILNYKMKIKYR
jgi:hypothetical protein